MSLKDFSVQITVISFDFPKKTDMTTESLIILPAAVSHVEKTMRESERDCQLVFFISPSSLSHLSCHSPTCCAASTFVSAQQMSLNPGITLLCYLILGILIVKICCTRVKINFG